MQHRYNRLLPRTPNHKPTQVQCELSSVAADVGQRTSGNSKDMPGSCEDISMLCHVHAHSARHRLLTVVVHFTITSKRGSCTVTCAHGVV